MDTAFAGKTVPLVDDLGNGTHVPVFKVLGGAATGGTPTTGGDASAANQVLQLARMPALAAGRIPVNALLADSVTINGPADLSAANIDLITGTTSGWFDAAAFQSASIQIVGGAGITAGQIIFEQTNDPLLAPLGAPLRASDGSAVNSNVINTAQVITANSQRPYKMQIDCRYVRARISTAFTGGTVRALCVFSQSSTAYSVVNVQQAVAGNLQTTATISGMPSVNIVPSGVAMASWNSTAGVNLLLPVGSGINLTGLYATNIGAAPAYIKLYNKASNPVLATDVPVMILPIPAAVNGIPGAVSLPASYVGWRFGVGLAVAITGGVSDADVTPIAAGQVRITINRT